MISKPEGGPWTTMELVMLSATRSVRPTRTDSGAELTLGALRPPPPPPPPPLDPPPPKPPPDEEPPKLAPVLPLRPLPLRPLPLRPPLPLELEA